MKQLIARCKQVKVTFPKKAIWLHDGMDSAAISHHEQAFEDNSYFKKKEPGFFLSTTGHQP